MKISFSPYKKIIMPVIFMFCIIFLSGNEIKANPVTNSSQNKARDLQISQIQNENEADVSQNSITEFDVLTECKKTDWNLILVNKQHPIPEDYTFTLGSISKGMKCDIRILAKLRSMIEAAKKENVTLDIKSPYRSEYRQEYLFAKKIKAYMKEHNSYLESYKLAAQAVTLPGSSEHQIGLALDIVSNHYTLLEEGFAQTKEGMWLAEHSHEYGFIVRYPKGKEDITGIEFEPWHFRYVGVNAATYIYENKLTLEEFVQLLE